MSPLQKKLSSLKQLPLEQQIDVLKNQGAGSLPKKNNKVIGIYDINMCSGGRSRVTSLLIQNFSNDGYRVILFTAEKPSPKDFDSTAAFQRIILRDNDTDTLSKACEEHDIQLFIIQQSPTSPQFDLIRTLKFLHKRIIFYNHSEYFALTSYPQTMHHIYRFAPILDAMLVLCPPEQTYWHSMGFSNVLLISNPLTVPLQTSLSPINGEDILWCGRMDVGKHPDKALEAFHKALPKLPVNTRLIMLGDGPLLKKMKAYACCLHIADRVLFTGQTNPLPYYSAASLHLMTSSSEAAPMVLAETKAFGVPTLMCDLPMTALAQTKGVVPVPQGDIPAMAQALAALLGDLPSLKALGAEAAASLTPFSHKHLMAQWENIINAVYSDSLPLTQNPDKASRDADQMLIIRRMTENFILNSPFTPFETISSYDISFFKPYHKLKQTLKKYVPRKIWDKIKSFWIPD